MRRWLALLAGLALVPWAGARAATPTPVPASSGPQVVVSAIATPCNLGDHLEAYGYITSAAGMPSWSVTGTVEWDGMQIGTMLPLQGGSVPPGAKTYLQFQSDSPVHYVPGMRDGDRVTMTIAPAGGAPVSVSWTLADVQPNAPGWTVAPAHDDNGWMPPLGDDPQGGTVAVAQVLVTRTADTPGTVIVGGNAVFDEAGGYFDQTWAYAPQKIRLAPETSGIVTLRSPGGIEPVYPGHVLVQTFHLSTGQSVSANTPVVAQPASGPAVVSATDAQVTPAHDQVPAGGGWVSAVASGTGTVSLAQPVMNLLGGMLFPVRLSGSFTALRLSVCGHLGIELTMGGLPAPNAGYDPFTGCMTTVLTAETQPSVSRFEGAAYVDLGSVGWTGVP